MDTKDLNYYKNNCEEDYIKTPISVLRYITELEQALQLHKTNVMRCGLSEAEFTERELLLELQRNSQRWFSQQEFDRLKELSNKMFANTGSPHIA